MKKNFIDIYLLLTSESTLHMREPIWVFVGIFEPLTYLLLFAPFLNGVKTMPGFPSENVIQFFAPGLLIMTALFGASYVGFGLLDKVESGVLERYRVTPISRLSLVLGYLLENALVLLVQSFILLVCSLFFGLQFHLLGLILLFILVLLIGIVMSSASCALSLILKDGGILASVINFVILPVYILSGIMLPLKFAPSVIQTVALFNPFYYAVTASRSLIDGIIIEPSVFAGFGLFAVLAVFSLIWFIKIMQDTVS
ncbi:MAG: ABC transporter permease [Bacteroidota bacterium]